MNARDWTKFRLQRSPLAHRCTHVALPGSRNRRDGRVRFHVCGNPRNHDGNHVCDGIECRPRHYINFVVWKTGDA